MKKFFKKRLLAFCLIACLSLIVGCKGVETFYLRVNLNDKDASYTQQYLDEKNFSSQNVSHIINPNNYHLFYDDMPTKADLTAPSGKTFAGWYLDEACSPDKYFNQTNWENHVASLGDVKSASIYAFWIDNTDLSVTVNLNGEVSFTDSYKQEKGFNEVLRIVGSPQEIFDNLPTANDIMVNEDRTFAGWCLDADGQTPVTVQSLTAQQVETTEITVYAKWDIRLTVKNSFSASLGDDTVPSEVRAFIFSDEMNELYNGTVSRKTITYNVFADEFDKVNTFASTLFTHVDQLNLTPPYQFAGWKIIKWTNGTREEMDFNEANWTQTTQSSFVNNNSVTVSIVATWTR